jgi:hypothetical protein
VLLAIGSAEAKEGFGRMNREVARLIRVRPPAVFLMATRIDVRIGGITSELAALARRLESQIEAELIERDSRLTIDPRSPEILIEVQVLQNVSEERWESRRMEVLRKVGTDSEGKDRYDWVETTVRFKIVIHRFEAAYTVTDLSQRRSLDGNTIQLPFQQEFLEGEGAPELFTLESNALAATADRIALRVTPSREVVGVLLPKGSLKDLSKLAQAGLWTRFLEALEALPTRPSPVDESYRQYALGTAYEALGYVADEPATTLRYLQQADVHYTQAIEANPDEKFFIQPYDSVWTSKTAAAPLDRVREGLASYRRLQNFRVAYGSLQSATVDSAGSSGDGHPEGTFDGDHPRAASPSAKELFYDPVAKHASRVSAVESDGPAASSVAIPVGGGGRLGADRRRIVNLSETGGDGARPIGLSLWIELASPTGGPGQPVTDRRVFRSGELIRLHFRSNADGYLTLILIGSSGTSTVLFPDPAQGLFENSLAAGRDLVVPGDDSWLRFDEAIGEERLLALFASSREDVEEFPLQPSMDRTQTAALLASAASARASKDLVVETETQNAAEIGTYGVHLGSRPVILELVLQHR